MKVRETVGDKNSEGERERQVLTLEMRQCRSPHCCQLKRWSTGSCAVTEFTRQLAAAAFTTRDTDKQMTYDVITTRGSM